MSVVRSRRAWVRVASAVLVLAAGWIIFVPVTSAFTVGAPDQAPTRVATLYSWWTSDQELVYSDATHGEMSHPAAAGPSKDQFVEGYRLDCGNVFTSGPNEQSVGSAGPEACAETELPRKIAGPVLAVLGVLVLLISSRIAACGRPANRYRQPYSQRRLLRRSVR